MTHQQQELIRYRLDRASETLEEAQIMLQTHHLHGAANRIYYACFYAVTALLLTRDFESPKHSGVMSLFNKHFVKPGIVSIDHGKFYSRMFNNRVESDYADVTNLDSQKIKEYLELAGDFIRTLTHVIDDFL